MLLDCQVPGMDGFETCRHLRTGGWTRPVLALTAGVTEDAQARCREARMDDILTKPATLSRLRGALVQWLPGGAVDEATGETVA